MKKCSKCEQLKPYDEFTNDRHNKDGKRSSCKECARVYDVGRKECLQEYHQRNKKRAHRRSREYRLRTKYGLTPQQYNDMLNTQNGVCAICGLPETHHNCNGDIKALSVDHCHATGKVRSLLCGSCNTLIGAAKDDIDILLSAISYLKNAYI